MRSCGSWEHELFVSSRNCFIKCLPVVISPAMEVFLSHVCNSVLGQSLMVSPVELSQYSMQFLPFWHSVPQTIAASASLNSYYLNSLWILGSVWLSPFCCLKTASRQKARGNFRVCLIGFSDNSLMLPVVRCLKPLL